MALSRRFRWRKLIQSLKTIFAISVVVGCLPIFGYFILVVPSRKPLAVARDIIINVNESRRDATNTNEVHFGLFDEARKTSTAEQREASNPGGNVTPSRKGNVEVHTWYDLCGMDVNLLRRWPHFPLFPDTRSLISKLDIPETNKRNFGQRIFGFIHPHTTSKYKFAISSDDTSELWLSPNEDPHSSRLIAGVYSASESAWTDQGDYKKYSSQISQEVALEARKKYYFEAILQQGNGLAHMTVYWACLSANSSFDIVSSEYLSTFFDYGHSIQSIGNLTTIPEHPGKPTKFYSKKESNSFYRLPLVSRGEYYSSFPSCPYSPSFLIKKRLKQFSGVWEVKASRTFPRDNTDMYSGIRGWSGPNLAADDKLIHKVISKLLLSLKSRKYVLERIHKVIQKEDPNHGNRFSVDLELRLQNTSQLYRWSEHVYLKNGNESLCFPEGIEWNNNATVYFILPVKDQGKWVYHFINQLSEVSLLTGDTNFHVIVIDFESQDIDMKKAFNTSLLQSRHTVVNLKGKFYKTLALNKGVELVPSPHDIVFLFDLHIDVPADILDSVRKNTIQGRIAYFPMVGRLNCGSTSSEHRGFWQVDGYGVAAVYKSDWIHFGGMNMKDFKYDWGGEDWDLVDRVLNAQLEIERVKQPGLFHHYHSKQRLWQAA